MIHLYANYYLDADEHQLILTKWNGMRDSRNNLQGATYHFYSDATALVYSLIQIMFREGVRSSNSIDDLVAKVEATTKIIETFANKTTEAVVMAAKKIPEMEG